MADENYCFYTDSDSYDEDDFMYNSGVEFGQEKKNHVLEPSPELTGELKLKWEKENAGRLLMKAVREDDFDAIEDLFGKGISVNSITNEAFSVTPLIDACCLGKPAMVRYLLELGANPNLHKELFTPLMACCPMSFSNEENLAECARLLLESKAQPNSTDKFKITALMLAAKHGHNMVLSELLAAPGIHVDAKDKDGFTALHYAASNGHKEIVTLLLAAKCDQSIEDRNGFTALNHAVNLGLAEIAELLGHMIPDVKTSIALVDPVDNFFNQLPDDNGNGGFYEDVKGVLESLGLGNLASELNCQPSFPEFLNMTDDNLKDIGIKLSPHRKYILIGIHKYHIEPWKKTSMCEVAADGKITMDDLLQVLSNTVKHLAILTSSVKYLQKRLVDKMEKKTETQRNMDLINFLISSQKEMKTVGLRPADFVGPQQSKKRMLWGPSLCSAVGVLALVALYLRW